MNGLFAEYNIKKYTENAGHIVRKQGYMRCTGIDDIKKCCIQLCPRLILFFRPIFLIYRLKLLNVSRVILRDIPLFSIITHPRPLSQITQQFCVKSRDLYCSFGGIHHTSDRNGFPKTIGFDFIRISVKAPWVSGPVSHLNRRFYSLVFFRPATMQLLSYGKSIRQTRNWLFNLRSERACGIEGTHTQTLLVYIPTHTYTYMRGPM